MSHHDGVSCDTCLKTNFRGMRYKCLVCFDYDLCGACRDSGSASARHRPDHPMQCIPTRNDLKLFYSGEAASSGQVQAFTCPFCGNLGYSEVTLYEHVNQEHSDSTVEVLCPICATLPNGEPNQLTRDFIAHMRLDHRTNTRDSIYEEPQIVRLRTRRPTQGGSGSNGGSNPGGSDNSLSTRYGRRRNFSPSVAATAAAAGGGTASATPSSRDQIAQLLNQLTEVRRYTGTGASAAAAAAYSNGGGNSNRVTLERLLMNARRQQSNLSSSASAMASHGGSSNHSTTSNASSYRILGSSDATSHHQSKKSQAAPSASVTSGSGHSGYRLPQQFLLQGLTLPSPSKSEVEAMNIVKADRSIFLQELLMATLSDSLDIGQLTTCDEAKGESSANKVNQAEMKEEDEEDKKSASNEELKNSESIDSSLAGGGGGGSPPPTKDVDMSAKLVEVTPAKEQTPEKKCTTTTPIRASRMLGSGPEEAASMIITEPQHLRPQRADSSSLHQQQHKANPFSATTGKFNHLGTASAASFLKVSHSPTTNSVGVTTGRPMPSGTQRKPRPPPGVHSWSSVPTGQSSSPAVGAGRRKVYKQTPDPE